MSQCGAFLIVVARIEGEAGQQVKEAHLEAIAEVALGGHELGQWEQVENGWQATCKLCQATSWIGKNGVRYSLLEGSCRGQENEDD